MTLIEKIREILGGFLMIGIVVGTYSSIYVAGSLAIAFGLTRSHLIPTQKFVDNLP